LLTEEVAASVDEGEDQGDLGDDQSLEGQSLQEEDGDGEEEQLDQGEDSEEGQQFLQLELAAGYNAERDSSYRGPFSPGRMKRVIGVWGTHT